MASSLLGPTETLQKKQRIELKPLPHRKKHTNEKAELQRQIQSLQSDIEKMKDENKTQNDEKIKESQTELQNLIDLMDAERDDFFKVDAYVTQLVKEFLAVAIFLVLYSRIGAYNFDSAGIGIMATLIVFNFPFMSPFLLAFAYLGIFRHKHKGQYFFNLLSSRIRLKLWMMLGFWVVHATAAYTAAHFRHRLDSVYGMEELDSSALNGPAALFQKKGNVTGVHDLIETETVNVSDMKKSWFFEEVIGVLLSLVGIMHIIEYDGNYDGHKRVWYVPEEGEKEPDTDKTPKKDEFGPAPAPISAIFHIAVFLVSMRIMFPTAHFNFTTTVYLVQLQKLRDDGNLFVNVDNNEHTLRFAGGVVGTVLALTYVCVVCDVLPTWKRVTRVLRVNPQLFAKEPDAPQKLTPLLKL